MEGILFSHKSKGQDFIFDHIHISLALFPNHPHCPSAALDTFTPSGTSVLLPAPQLMMTRETDS